MASDRLILISDVHIDEWNGDLGVDQAGAKAARFLEFLQWVADAGAAGTVGQFYINGDLIDVPQQDRSPLLPEYEAILEGFKGIIAAGVKFGYVIGNHDSGLVGLDIALSDQSLTINYPYLQVQSAGKKYIIEHGHLYDPWLWDYVRQAAKVMWTADPTANPESAPLMSSAMWQATMQGQAPAAGHPDPTGQLVADIERVYDDVIRPEIDTELAQARDALRRALHPLDAAPAQEPTQAQLVQAYYSGPHWRQAAVTRLDDLSHRLGASLAGITMGHTHYPDTFEWPDAQGEECQYVNSGSWRYDRADIVVIDEGGLQLHARAWGDALPLLS